MSFVSKAAGMGAFVQAGARRAVSGTIPEKELVSEFSEFFGTVCHSLYCKLRALCSLSLHCFFTLPVNLFPFFLLYPL